MLEQLFDQAEQQVIADGIAHFGFSGKERPVVMQALFTWTTIMTIVEERAALGNSTDRDLFASLTAIDLSKIDTALKEASLTYRPASTEVDMEYASGSSMAMNHFESLMNQAFRHV